MPDRQRETRANSARSPARPSVIEVIHKPSALAYSHPVKGARSAAQVSDFTLNGPRIGVPPEQAATALLYGKSR